METKQYFQSPSTYVVPLVFSTFVLGTMGITGIANAEAGSVVMGSFILAILGAAYGLVFALVKRPSLEIKGSQVKVRGALGKLHNVEDVREYSLVLASDWIGFRKSGHGDIILEQHRFPKNAWPEMIAELQKLPFAHVV